MTNSTSNLRVAVLMGSDSDLVVMAEAVKVLSRMGVEYRVAVTSAHRSPQRTVDIVHEMERDGVRVFVVGAGAAAHLAGVVAAHTTKPVLGVPLAASDLQGLDALLATVQMPGGIPVGTLAIGKAGATNAGWLAAAILALDDDRLAEKLRAHREAQADKVRLKSEAALEKLPSLLDS